MNGWAALPKFSVAKKTPESKYIGSMTRFMSPLTVSVVVARLATSSPIPAKARAPMTSIRKRRADCRGSACGKRALPVRAGSRHRGSERSGVRRDRAQEIAPRHGSGDEALEQLADPEIHQEEADPPESASHGIDPDETRNQAIDIPSSRLVDLNVNGLPLVLPAGGRLKDIIDHLASGCRFRTSRVITVRAPTSDRSA